MSELTPKLVDVTALNKQLESISPINYEFGNKICTITGVTAKLWARGQHRRLYLSMLGTRFSTLQHCNPYWDLHANRMAYTQRDYGSNCKNRSIQQALEQLKSVVRAAIAATPPPEPSDDKITRGLNEAIKSALPVIENECAMSIVGVEFSLLDHGRLGISIKFSDGRLLKGIIFLEGVLEMFITFPEPRIDWSQDTETRNRIIRRDNQERREIRWLLSALQGIIRAVYENTTLMP